MNRLRKHSNTLKFLHSAKPSLRKAVIAKASPDLIKTICDCSLNLLSGNIHTSPKTRKQLCRYKASLRKLANPKLCIKQKQRVIQNGGFLGALLSAALPIVTSLLGSLANR